MEYGYFDAFLKSLYINFSILGFRKFITWKNEICSITKAILTGANLASPTCHGTGCFFASSRGYAVKICLESFPISLEASWHWLILASIGAIDCINSPLWRKVEKKLCLGGRFRKQSGKVV